jgi:hypothetical protein
MLAVGMLTGVAIGVAVDRLALWTAIGVAIGLALDATQRRRRTED